MSLSFPIVCLGNKNWTKLRPLAVSVFINNNQKLVSDIIFSWWYTQWHFLPSEAEQMRDYFISIHNSESLKNHKILTEESSCDTVENAKNVKQILWNKNLKIILITSNLKISRAVYEFQQNWFEVDGFWAEDILRSSWKLNLDTIKSLTSQEESVYEFFLEPIARVMMRLDFIKTWVRFFTKKRIK